MDADAASELVNEIAGTQLGHLDTFEIDLRKDRVVLDVLAPSDAETWKGIEKALVVLVESWSRRWTTYR